MKEKSRRVQLCLPPLLPSLLPPCLHHLAFRAWKTDLEGRGASVLSVLFQCLRVYYQLSLTWRSPVASHSQSFTNTNTQTNTQALCNIWTLFTLCFLSSSYVGLFVAALPKLVEENRENKARKKRKMEKREPRCTEEEKMAGKLMFKLYGVLPVVAHKISVGEHFCATAWYGDRPQLCMGNVVRRRGRDSN